MRVLIIDDDLTTLEVIRDEIAWESFGVESVEIALNMASAQVIIRQQTPDIILCDIEMPKGTGIDLLKWLRESEIDSQFIFLTCHENFSFAATAIALDAIAYVTKPFQKKKVEDAITKAVDRITKKKQQERSSLMSEYWLSSQALVEQSFWRDLVFGGIPSRDDTIRREVEKRHLVLDTTKSIVLVLTTVEKSRFEETNWEEADFIFALGNMTSEVVLNELCYERIFSYVRNDHFCHLAILKDPKLHESLQERCANLVQLVEKYLQCPLTCYVSDEMTLREVAQTREALEEADRNNLLQRGGVMRLQDKHAISSEQPYMMDINLYNRLFLEADKVGIVNSLRHELAKLEMEKRLTPSTMHVIHQDFVQVAYAVLYRNGIKAHSLFSDESSRKQFQHAENSVFDMMKWATFLTNKTIDYLRDAKLSTSVVEKAKRFIHEHYAENIGRDEIADMVFLTPDYLAKIFKADMGIHIKEYLNEYRIEKAKELLMVGTDSVSDIAVKCGFDNFSYFSTLFKKLTHHTPIGYRKMVQQRNK